MKTFINYAREDSEIAKNIYADLKNEGIDTWIDTEDILPGQNWKHEIQNVIKGCKFFLALISSSSLSKKGYVQKELSVALSMIDELPPNEIFVIPVRVNECKPIDERLNNIHWVDLFPKYEDGLKKILNVIKKDREINELSIPNYDDFIGRATSNLMPATPSPFGTKGFVKRFIKGSIYLLKEIGKAKLDFNQKENDSYRITNSNIGMKYESIKGTSSPLGFPISEVAESWKHKYHNNWLTKGYVQWFEGGNIYFTERFGAHTLFAGNIRNLFAEYEEKYQEKFNENMTGGILGFPISDQKNVFSLYNKTGIVQRFQYGLITDWAKGTYGIVRGFNDLYQSIGEWNSKLGFPESEEKHFKSKVTRYNGVIQSFENGCLIWNHHVDLGTYIHGDIYKKWLEADKILGFPLNYSLIENEYEVQYFEGGVIKFDNNNCSIVIEEKNFVQEYYNKNN